MFGVHYFLNLDSISCDENGGGLLLFSGLHFNVSRTEKFINVVLDHPGGLLKGFAEWRKNHGSCSRSGCRSILISRGAV